MANEEKQLEVSQIRDAIETVKKNGWDVNPYTIADNLKCDMTQLYQEPVFMSLILEARNYDCTFPDVKESKKIVELEKTVEELEKENNNLATKISELEDSSSPDEISDQVLELIRSESADQIKLLEDDLTEAKTQAKAKQEEIEEQERTIAGLEKVNEAVNSRLRELEDKLKEAEARQPEEDTEEVEKIDPAAYKELEKVVEDQKRALSGLEKVNETLNKHIFELEAENKGSKARREEELAEAGEGAADSAELTKKVEDMSRAMAGLEKVNSAINKRLLELEEENKELKARSEESSDNPESETVNAELEEKVNDLTRTLSGLERVNEAINGRLLELENENKELKGKIEANGSSSEDLNSKLEDDNLRLTEALKNEQDKFNSISDQLKELTQTNESLTREHQELLSNFEDLQKDAENMAAQLQNAWRMQQQAQAAEQQSNAQKPEPKEPVKAEAPAAQAEEPVAQAEEKVETHELKRDESAVVNFTKSGPYVSSDFNPLKEMRWKDLETVYSMGVLSVKDFNQQIPEPDSEQVVKLDDPNKADESNGSDTLRAEESYDEEEENPQSMIPDFDQLDIFEDIEELEELGKIQVPDDMLADVPVDEVGKVEEKPTEDDLRDLVAQRIKMAEEHKVEPTVKIPPSAGGEAVEDPKAGGGFKNKFVGGNAKPSEVGVTSSTQNAALNIKTNTVPPEIRKHCQLLGIDPAILSEEKAKEKVSSAWKKLMISPEVHPDLGGDNEGAVILNSAKEALHRYIEDKTPKLGKKFGAPKDMSSRFTGKKKE